MGEHEGGLIKEAAKLLSLDVFRNWTERKILIFLSIYDLPKSACDLTKYIQINKDP